MTLTKINFITGNKNKLSEVRAILGSVIEIDNQAVDVPEIQGTIEEIAKEKASRAAEAVRSVIDLIFRAFCLILNPIDQWTGFDRGHSAGVPRTEGPPWAIHVRINPPKLLRSKESHKQSLSVQYKTENC